MDPFVIASLGRKTHRTRVIRHNLNPIYDEKMVFQVMRHEYNYSLSFSIVDRDKLSGNDFVGTVNFPLSTITSVAPEADPDTGLYALQEPPDWTPLPVANKSRFRLPLSRSSSATSLNKLSRPGLQSKNSSSAISQSDFGHPLANVTSEPANGSYSVTHAGSETAEDNCHHPFDPDLKAYTVELVLKHKEKWEDKHATKLHIKAKYMPYPALRQQFWRAMLKQYDADESARISKVELTTMLDTLGSTLKESTIDSWFQRFSKENGPVEDLTFDQATICLEDQLQSSNKKKSWGESAKDMMAYGQRAIFNDGVKPEPRDETPPTVDFEESLNQQNDTADVSTIAPEYLGLKGENGDMLDKDDLLDDRGEEHVIEIRECPLCHQPRLNKRSDADIITHIATCASQDWRQVNNIVMAGFVTSSQAQRKWYSKVITKISYGGYKLGANSANILVQDRLTGQINEERMSVYVRLGIRLLYKGLKSRDMEKKRSVD